MEILALFENPTEENLEIEHRQMPSLHFSIEFSVFCYKPEL
jgi:hypothetical protein